MVFALHALRFGFIARDSVYFPPGKSSNILRGAFGDFFRKAACVPGCRSARYCERQDSCAYARIFEPRPADGPSGFADLPRPFVFRAAHLDGRRFGPNEQFSFDLHLFDIRDPAIASFVFSFQEIARRGIGPRKGRADLLQVNAIDSTGQPGALIYANSRFAENGILPPLSLSLNPVMEGVGRVEVRFVTPIELKGGGEVVSRPDFAVLFARIRDRLSLLSAVYGGGPLTVDFASMGRRSESIKLVRSELRNIQVERRSSRTGQVHSIGGFTGVAEYEGDLDEFLPYLEAARWSGAGRQTVWGKGEIHVRAI